jgi:DNA-binding MarR family transcriptional regulator
VSGNGPESNGHERIINPRSAYDWSRISNELDDMALSPSAFRVFCNLLRRSDKHSHTCYPGTRRIAHDCKMNRETVIEALRELEGQGMLKVERGWGETLRLRNPAP